MTEIAIREEQPDNGPSSLEKWASDARQVNLIAESICKTSFVPKPFLNKPNEVTAAILAGAEVGLSPMASLRAINVIQGTPAMSALAMRGVVQAHGHEIWVEESSDTRAVVCGRRAGSDQVQRVEWTIERARRMGLTGKDNWKNQPGTMLIARGTSEMSRLIGADALVGLGYSTEELTDDAAPKPVRKTVQRREIPAVPEPDLPAIEPAQTSTSVTDAQPDPEVIDADTDEWPTPAPIGATA